MEGVKSDVIVPDSYMHIFNGEKDEENPLAWDRIDPAMYNPWINEGSLDFISSNAQSRVNDNNYLKLMRIKIRRRNLNLCQNTQMI